MIYQSKMKYLQRLRGDIRHSESVVYLFKDKLPKHYFPVDYEILFKYNDTSNVMNNGRALYYCAKYWNIQLMIKTVLGKKDLAKELMCCCAGQGRIKLLKFFHKFYKSKCKWVMNHAANGHPKCMRLLKKLGYRAENIVDEKCLYPIYADVAIEYAESIAANGHIKCLKLLHKWKALIDAELLLVASEGHPKCFKYIFQKMVDKPSNQDVLMLYRYTRTHPKCKKILYDYDRWEFGHWD